ncbi:MAG: response regulator transcription factor [Oscillospiraceae bacterium]|nr:response regulator transcription factor [Oscillospiraceae bacterium]
MRKIYIVEDDEDIREIVLYALHSAGFDAAGFVCGEDLFEAVDAGMPALILLDIMLPGDDGLTILKNLRNSQKTKTLPIIMLTAKGSEFDKVKGLDLGADDYLSKPFGVMELISRIKAVLRRSGEPMAGKERLQCAGILLDSIKRDVSVDGAIITLTYKEYELLHYLMLNKGIALDREKIMTAVWGYDFAGESRTLDMHIRSLRQKLGEAGKLIKTIRNVGYKLESETP